MHGYSESRYLEAKRTVDDRALNRGVVEVLRAELARRTDRAPRILELGAGIGTMACRLVDWQVLPRCDYVLLDVSEGLLSVARERLANWGRERGYSVERHGERLHLRGPAGELSFSFVVAELHDFLTSGQGDSSFDLLIANAFLDLVDVPFTLPKLFEHAAADGLYWFTINFDGETTFLPEHPDDPALLTVYHQSMDERVRNGRPSGDSKTGRHLFARLGAAGASILSAGSSDWVVCAQGGAYPADEAYFLRHLVHTVHEELRRHPELSSAVLEAWSEQRQAQIERAELTLIVHQLDFVGRARA
jgi:SAM-dependent methyltransferase